MGPSYAAPLVRILGAVDTSRAHDASELIRPRHTQRIPGQLSLFRHRPGAEVEIRMEPGDDPLVVRLRQEAARAPGADDFLP